MISFACGGERRVINSRPLFKLSVSLLHGTFVSEIIDKGIGSGIENEFGSSTRWNSLLCSSLFSLCRCLLSFLVFMLVGPQLAQSRLTVFRIRYCPMALPAK